MTLSVKHVGNPLGPEIRQGIGGLMKNFLEKVLPVIDLESGAEVVPIDEIAINREAAPLQPGRAAPCSEEEVLSKGYDKLASYKPQEPRLVMLGNFLNHMVRCAELRSHGRRVQVDGFRLGKLSSWVRYPQPRVLDNFGEICSWCSCNCEICFLKGAELGYTKRAMLTVAEARTRAKYFSTEKKLGLPVGHAQPGEPFLNPRIMDILRIAREADPGLLLDITTNADFLTPEVIGELAELKPISIVVSINSANGPLRRKIMRSSHAAVGIKAIALLREAGIQFIGSIVGPASVPVEDIAETARYLDRHSALQVRLLLPGFTRFHPEEVAFDTPSRWGAIVRTAQQLRQEFSTPIMIQPGLFWNQDISAVVDGIYRNSPAERVGLKFGDRIVEIDGQVIITKAEASDLLRVTPEEEAERGCFRRILKVERGDEILEVELRDDSLPHDDYYPYKPAGYGICDRSFRGNCFGIHLIDGFRLESLKTIKESVGKHPGVRKVLLFTTPLVKNLFAQAMMIVGNSPEFKMDSIELRVTVAEQRYWGGNIVIGDLHVVQDYIDHVLMLARGGYRPDLVLIPKSFVGEWGFDVLGESYFEIERRTGVSVELLTNVRVMM
jgi:hypothetical protein